MPYILIFLTACSAVHSLLDYTSLLKILIFLLEKFPLKIAKECSKTHCLDCLQHFSVCQRFGGRNEDQTLVKFVFDLYIMRKTMKFGLTDTLN